MHSFRCGEWQRGQCLAVLGTACMRVLGSDEGSVTLKDWMLSAKSEEHARPRKSELLSMGDRFCILRNKSTSPLILHSSRLKPLMKK
jgi:hypothetical protein